jgi:integrase
MLTATEARQAKPKDKPYKLRDSENMYLLVNRSGKYWRWDYRFHRQRRTAALGVFPKVSLKEARDCRDDWRKLLESGVDIADYRRAQKQSRARLEADSFGEIAAEWHTAKKAAWVAAHSAKVWRRLEKDALPWLGKRPIAAITAPEVLNVCRRIESRGAVEAAHRALQGISSVFRYAIATGRAESDVTRDLRGALQSVKEKHHASITEPKKIGELLRAIDGYSGQPVTKCALQLAPLVFVRPTELRHAEWSEIDFDAAEWRIPAEKMKMRAPHIIPLSRQVVEVLRELEPLTGDGKYLFPSLRAGGRCMSENTVNAALRRLGFAKDEMTGHGFRSMASTRLHELGYKHEAIERQLAHAERNKVSAAYNYAEHLPERRRLMEAWSDYLDGLKAGAKVTPIRKGAA